MKEQPLLETDRLILEPLTRLHVPEMFPILSDPELFRYIPHDPPVSLDALEARFGQLERRHSPMGDQAWLNWVIRSKTLGVCVGRVEATVCQDKSARLAYELGSRHWRQGFATEACRRVVGALFEEYGVERIIAEVDTRNASSIRLLERLGFERGPLKVGADFFKGAPSDEVVYTLSRQGEQRPSPGVAPA